MPNPNKARGTRFEYLVRDLLEEDDIPCVRPHGSSGASLRAVGLDYSDEVDLITDFLSDAEATWQCKQHSRSVPTYLYDYDEGVAIYCDEEQAYYVALRWETFVRWFRYWRQTATNHQTPTVPKITLDRLVVNLNNHVKPQGANLGRIVRDSKRRRRTEAPIVVLREQDYYAPFELD